MALKKPLSEGTSKRAGPLITPCLSVYTTTSKRGASGRLVSNSMVVHARPMAMIVVGRAGLCFCLVLLLRWTIEVNAAHCMGVAWASGLNTEEWRCSVTRPSAELGTAGRSGPGTSSEWTANVLRFCDAPTISNLRLKLISAQLSMTAIGLHNRRRCDDLVALAARLANFKDDVRLPLMLRTTLTNYWQVISADGRTCARQAEFDHADGDPQKESRQPVEPFSL